MKTKAVAVFLVLLVVGGDAAKPLLANQLIGLEQILKDDRLNGLGHTAVINDYIETTIPMMVELIKRHELDPLPLPNLEEGFYYRPLLVTYSGELALTNGRFENMVSVYRNGDAVVSYFAHMLRIRLELAFKDLEFGYDYKAKLMDIGPSGKITGSLSHINIEIDILVDFNNDEVHLQHFTFSEIGRLRVRMSGNFLTDWFMNPVIAVFTRLFDTVIIGTVEVAIRSALNFGIAEMNALIKSIFDGLD